MYSSNVKKDNNAFVKCKIQYVVTVVLVHT